MGAQLLSNLLREFPFRVQSDSSVDANIVSITADSRKVTPGALFVAMSGTSSDGHRFIPDAIQNGAAAVVGEQDIPGLPVLRSGHAVPYLRVANSRQSLAYLSAAFFGYPARRMTMVGVTGTDGKTTTCNLVYQILLAAGYKTGMISTVNAVIGDELLDTGFHVTTPEAPEVQGYLAKMQSAGLTHVVLETTSHGWAQFRSDACEFDIGAITNVTHEHLDYHGSYENYLAAKARLFTSLKETRSKAFGNIRLAVLNRDDSSYEKLAPYIQTPSASYGFSKMADVHAKNAVQDPDGIRFTVMGPDFHFDIKANLFGLYNVSNCLAAITVAVMGMKIPVETVARGISNLTGVPGRMERINLGQNFTAIVDFAHTPNALKVSLETARLMLQNNPSEGGRVITVFGSAGLRDKQKRRLMAEVASQLADISILTAEDPRTESLDGILEEMASGARIQGGVEGKTFWCIRDRGEAIRLAVKSAQPGDLVIICGKGHEQSMCFGTTEYAWDDRVALRSALSEIQGIPGPAMPFLPTRERA